MKITFEQACDFCWHVLSKSDLNPILYDREADTRLLQTAYRSIYGKTPEFARAWEYVGKFYEHES